MDTASRFQAFDLLATLVAVVDVQGTILFTNSALEDAVGTSRRALQHSPLAEAFTDAQPLYNALQGLHDKSFAALRYDSGLKRLGAEPLPVHVIVTGAEPRSSCMRPIACKAWLIGCWRRIGARIL